MANFNEACKHPSADGLARSRTFWRKGWVGGVLGTAVAAGAVAILFLAGTNGGAQPQPAAGAGAEPREAGAKFWEALRRARERKYEEAVKSLDKALELHEKYRFQRLGQAQNPISDPNEQIFIESGKELKAYWDLRAKLSAADPDLAKLSPEKAIQKLLDDRKAAEQALADASKPLVDGKYASADDPPAKRITTGVTNLLADKKKCDDERKVADDTLKAAADLLKTDKKDVPDGVKKALAARAAADTKVQDVSRELAAAGVKTDDPTAGVKDLAAVKNDLDQVAKRLAPKYIPATTNVLTADGRRAVLNGLDQMLHAGELPLGAVDLVLALREPRKRTPQELVGLWARVMSDRHQRAGAEEALKDADAVAKDPKADEEAKGRAAYVKGLALRNLGEFDKARTALKDAVKTPGKAQSWHEAAQKALDELQDPDVYYLARAKELHHEAERTASDAARTKRDNEAVSILDEGLGSSNQPGPFPNNARLLALRSRIHLDQAVRAAKGGKVLPDTPHLTDAQNDAQAAVKSAGKDRPADLADAYLALGRVAEEREDWTAAQTNYDNALKALEKAGGNKKLSELRDRCKVALARVLLRLHNGQPVRAGANEKAEPSRVSRRPGRRELVVASATLLARAELFGSCIDCPILDGMPALYPPPVRQLPVSTSAGRPGESRAELSRRLREAIGLTEAAAVTDKEALLIKALARAQNDDWTRGLKDYVDGLKVVIGDRASPEEVAALNGLHHLVFDNPAFRLPPPPPSQRRVSSERQQATRRALELADELIQANDPHGYLLRGQALAQQQRWKEAVLAYADGLKRILQPQWYGNGLYYLVSRHPTMQRPDVVYPPNDLAVARHFAAGVERYWSGDYRGAEAELIEALKYPGQDARILYYLGLTRLALPEKEDSAYDDFRLAGQLESQNLPSSPMVGRSLERVQGPVRVLLDEKAGRSKRRRPARPSPQEQ